MNIIGEYSLHYNIYTMFNVYNVKISNHNLITNSGYEFFMRKWYQDEEYPIELGYYDATNDKFYAIKHTDGTFEEDLSEYRGGKYSTTTNYIDKETYKQYLHNGSKFVGFHEKLDKICIGKYNYINDEVSKPLETDIELYDAYSVEHNIEDFEPKATELLIKCTLENEDLNGTTEIGIKTNHGTLVSHDIHPPYNLPFGTNLTLEYVFKLK